MHLEITGVKMKVMQVIRGHLYNVKQCIERKIYALQLYTRQGDNEAVPYFTKF